MKKKNGDHLDLSQLFRGREGRPEKDAADPAFPAAIGNSEPAVADNRAPSTDDFRPTTTGFRGATSSGTIWRRLR